jgi:hypothetical protein
MRVSDHRPTFSQLPKCALNRQHIIIFSDIMLEAFMSRALDGYKVKRVYFFYQILSQDIILSQYNPFYILITSFPENNFNIWTFPVITVEKFSVSNFYMNILIHCTYLFSNKSVAMIFLWKNEWKKETGFASKLRRWQENCHFSRGRLSKRNIVLCVFTVSPTTFRYGRNRMGQTDRHRDLRILTRKSYVGRLGRLFRAVTNLCIEVYVMWCVQRTSPQFLRKHHGIFLYSQTAAVYQYVTGNSRHRPSWHRVFWFSSVSKQTLKQGASHAALPI